jgi:GNAT superfamily N-acetyltransferase
VIDEDSLPLADAVLARAEAGDAAELLILQRCCWVSEAILNDTLEIPALREDLDTVRGWIATHHVWIIRAVGRLVAAVRAHQDEDRWEIGRLMVAPDLAGRGVGRWLLQYAERQAPAGVNGIHLFTGQGSERNLRMYRSAGYIVSEPPPDEPSRHIRGVVHLSKAPVDL